MHDVKAVNIKQRSFTGFDTYCDCITEFKIQPKQNEVNISVMLRNKDV